MNLHKKIAIFGSAFNPPTLGHLNIIQGLSHFDNILLVPSFSHAWGKKMADFEKRCQWVSDFINDVGTPSVQLCTDEKNLSEGEAITTWTLLNHMQTQYPDAQLTFVIGPDNLRDFFKFHRCEDILKRWNILTCPEILPIRSTEIRNRLLKKQDISHLTTPRLAETLTRADFS